MIIGRSTLPAASRKPLLVLSVSAFLTACTGGMGDIQPSAAAPVFTSAPQTSAVQDTTYTYQVSTQPASGAVTLALASAPLGAAIDGNTITWTPTAAQSRVPNQFSVTATNTAGRATQSWTVTPSGTITGSWIETYWTATGPVQVPFNLATGLPPMALVPQPDGSFQTVQGSGNADGTFSIPNVPAGYYWLAPTPRPMYWTSSGSIDLGIDFNGSPRPGTIASATTTTLDFNLSGLDPLQAGDEVAFLSNPSPLPFIFGASTPAGATTLSAGELADTNFDFSQIHSGFLPQYEPAPVAGLTISALGAEATLSNLTLNNGSVNTIAANLAHSPTATFDLNVKGTAWTPLFSNAAPTQPSLEGSDLSLITEPYLNSTQFVPAFGFGVPLLIDPQELSLPGCPPSGTGSTGLVAPGPCQPPVTTDQDFGLVQYGDPFPSAWPRVFTFSQTAMVPLPLPGSTSTFPFTLTDSESTGVPSSPISPLISQVQNPTINGSSLFVAATVPATGVTLSWTAPSGAAPTGYKIATLVEATVPLNGSLAYEPGLTFYTAKTSVPLPPLQAGKIYVFVIAAILDGAANFETSPNRSALPTASVSIISAPITITGP